MVPWIPYCKSDFSPFSKHIYVESIMNWNKNELDGEEFVQLTCENIGYCDDDIAIRGLHGNQRNTIHYANHGPEIWEK